jgi:hypothetical protein
MLYLPAADAVGVFAVLDEHARHAGPTDDERSMDARRTDPEPLIAHPPSDPNEPPPF